MVENFKIDIKEIDKIHSINQDDKNYRIQNLEFFNQKGFPTKPFGIVHCHIGSPAGSDLDQQALGCYSEMKRVRYQTY